MQDNITAKDLRDFRMGVLQAEHDRMWQRFEIYSPDVRTCDCCAAKRWRELELAGKLEEKVR